jgi:acetyl-CoA carboxylase biotin carboxyl carrier protein
MDRTAPAPPGAGTATPATPAAAIAVPPTAPEPPAGSAVRAPLVGTFYAAPSPGSDPFVQVGDLIRAGQPVAIIEAMKLMNRVEADRDGVVLEVLVADGEAVEYDQPLLVLGAPDSPAAQAAGPT